MRTLIVSLFLLMLCGCQNMQSQKSTDSNAVIGRVIAVEPRGLPFAAVGDVQPNDIHAGDKVTFMDKDQKMLTSGIVRRVTDDAVHVEWMKPAMNGRAPHAGDLAAMHRSMNHEMTSEMNPGMNSPATPATAPTDAMTPSSSPTTQNSQ